MSRTGQAPEQVITTALGTVVSSWQLTAGEPYPEHRHHAHQLSFASVAPMAMGAAGRTWVLPRSRGLWIPAGVPHSVQPLGASEMTTLWLEPDRCPIRWDHPTVVLVDELLLGLMSRLRDPALSSAERHRTERVLVDVLTPLPADELDLALPDDERARQVAEAVLLDPADACTLVEWGRRVGASERTLMRSFRADTGLGFQEWRTRARVTAALRLLLTDAPITAIAGAVGYSTTSAFCAAFRRTMGAPASTFRAGR